MRDVSGAGVRPFAWAFVAGCLGVVATCIFYRLSPAAAAMPVIPVDIPAARAGAVSGAATLRLAGLFGMTGDLLMTAGAFGIGAAMFLRGAGLRALGWILIGLSTIVYTVVDAMVGFAIPVAANGEGFAVWKSLLDMMFMQGAVTFGLGGLVLLTAELIAAYRSAPRVLLVVAFAAAAAALVGGAGGLLGLSGLDQMTGLSIAGGATSFAGIGLLLALRGLGAVKLSANSYLA